MLRFDASLEIRPTTNAARECLFNWLQNEIVGADCLDLFAGSGAIGFEALSRGASSVVFVDSSRDVIRYLRKTAESLNSSQHAIFHRSALRFLKKADRKFDVVFLDPPYFQNLVISSLELLESKEHLNHGALVYVETERNFEFQPLHKTWEQLRHYKAGRRAYFLIRLRNS